MNTLRRTENGFAQIVILGVMALSILSLSVATKFAQKNQDNRSKATENTNVTTKPRLYFESSKITRYVGETFEVSVSADSASNKISGVDIVGSYDATKLELISMKKSDSFVFGDRGDCAVKTNDLTRFLASCWFNNSTNDSSASGKLITMVFKAKAEGPAEFSFDCVNGSTYDSNIISENKDIITCEENMKMHVIVMPMENSNIKTIGNFVDLNLDKEYLKVISDDKLKLWLSRLDMAYEDYADLTGWKPYNGGKISIDSVECGNTCAGWAWAGQSISWPRQWWQEAELKRINDKNDWSFGILHEMSHDFDNYESWGDFDNEMMSNFKMAYFLEKRNGLVQPNGDDVYYSGADIIKVYKSHPEYGYDVILKKYKDGKNEELKQSIGNFLNYKLLVIKDNIGGWDTYKQVFRNLGDKKIIGQNNKINTFFDEMSKVSKKDVRSMFNQEERNILEIKFGKIFSSTLVTPTPIPISKINGKCGNNISLPCINGSVSWKDKTGSDGSYNWICLGKNGGISVSCSLKKSNNKTDAVCGVSKNKCTKGKLSDTADTSLYYTWICKGINGGATKICRLRKTFLNKINLIK